MTSSTDKLTEREQEIIAILSGAFANLMLDARILDAYKQDGRTVSTLRFTVNEEASTDLERSRIEQGDESVEELARLVSAELQDQLPEQLR